MSLLVGLVVWAEVLQSGWLTDRQKISFFFLVQDRETTLLGHLLMN
jgi:hypothetical protein